ncbi:methyltransferase domain-containing protein [Colletotrichum graminicola]|uniref:Methyltransferase domain-containing protein n=1 Tax=Colletotrichum graminicola (strain M1.001 / M2 / FGSC 10212) TaxID=645133 RepID=E3QMN9_COLGM|nr:methyltransferase domain-containing protein [Colletotrichum graminicola M1.001]EFQ32127.1 methyltransferase domain-containing protein [Colletotrichum graminicola M1.001]WDK16977.1 methyltransferase domain-containing protein [Colletotrichum graminicola]
MSVFARSTFSAAGYAAFRPSYPASLFKMLLAYHKPSSANGTALDLGCGHGVIARELAPHFGRVMAVDPSAGMVKQASESTRDPKITFRQGSAEDLSFVGDGTVDLAIAGQSAHWFDYKRAWPELGRVVCGGGTLAFWGYKDNILVGFPAVNEILEHFLYGEGEAAPGSGWETMERYWEKPGRQMLRDNLEAVVPPASEWTAVRRIVYNPDRRMAQVGTGPEAEAAWQRKKLKLGEFEGYVHTFSAYIGWRDAHPEVKSRAEGGEGDIADLLFDRLLEAVPEWKAKGDKWREVEVEAVWGTVVILAKRR